MIITLSINNSLRVDSLTDLNKLMPLMKEGVLKLNKSKIARELDIDRRTVDKYLNGFQKAKHRSRTSPIDAYYDLIEDLLSKSCEQVFFYKKVLWQYLKDNHGLECAESTFRAWILRHSEFASYFDGSRNRTVNSETRGVSSHRSRVLHLESEPGEEAQLDWKEDMNFKLKNGETIHINVFSLVYSYSRFKVFYLSLSRKRDVLLHLLDQAFETAGGVPKALKTDNMKTVMDEPRTARSKGKVNARFEQFAKDYGFETKPCIAGHPWSKGKVENPMKALDELFAYNGKLDLYGLCLKLKEINERLNASVHTTTGKIPILHMEKEKDFLQALPDAQVRNLYRIPTLSVKVDPQCMISYKGNKYSVDPRHLGKKLNLQAYEGYLYLYDNTELAAVHAIADKKWNYQEEHYTALTVYALKDDSEEIRQLAKKNLKTIGDLYDERNDDQ